MFSLLTSRINHCAYTHSNRDKVKNNLRFPCHKKSMHTFVSNANVTVKKCQIDAEHTVAEHKNAEHLNSPVFLIYIRILLTAK